MKMEPPQCYFHTSTWKRENLGSSPAAAMPDALMLLDYCEWLTGEPERCQRARGKECWIRDDVHLVRHPRVARGRGDGPRDVPAHAALAVKACECGGDTHRSRDVHPPRANAVYEDVTEHGPHYLNAETGLRTAACGFGARVLIVCEEPGAGVVLPSTLEEQAAAERESGNKAARR
jgi:hypothetical protein